MKRRYWCIMLLCVCFWLSGCETRVPPDTRCNVFGIRGNFIENRTVCNYEETYYYCSRGGIYQYKDGNSRQMVELDMDNLAGIACDKNTLYYRLIDRNIDSDDLYCLNLENGVTELVELGKQPYKIIIGKQKVFLTIQEDEEYVIYTMEDSEKKRLCAIRADGREGDKVEIASGDYLFRGEYNEDGWRISHIRFKDEWQYAAYDIWFHDKYLTVSNAKYTYDDIEYTMKDVVEKKTSGAGTAYTMMTIYENKLYILYHYGARAEMMNFNPYFKAGNDAIYSLEPETGEVELVYRPEDSTVQIADFSIEHDCLYLLKNDGLYRCNMKGEEEEFLLENTYEVMTFENCNGKLFVYDGDCSDDAELIAVIDDEQNKKDRDPQMERTK